MLLDDMMFGLSQSPPHIFVFLDRSAAAPGTSLGGGRASFVPVFPGVASAGPPPGEQVDVSTQWYLSLPRWLDSLAAPDTGAAPEPELHVARRAAALPVSRSEGATGTFFGIDHRAVGGSGFLGVTGLANGEVRSIGTPVHRIG